MVVSGPSYSGPTKTDLRINDDETLASFYHKLHGEKEMKTRISSDQIFVDDGSLVISFQRTIRVPDDGKTHHLPPGLGKFPIHNIAGYSHKLSRDTVEKGGVFIAMYRM